MPGSGLSTIDSTLVSVGLRSRVGRSSANARPWVASVSGSPLLNSDSGVSVATPLVRSHFSGPGIGRSGGSASGPDPGVHAVNPPVGHLYHFGTDYAVVLG